jgi:hypothetical protein
MMFGLFIQNFKSAHRVTHARLLASTETSIGYHTKGWFIALTAVLFIPPIFIILVPLVLCPQLAVIFHAADSQTISAALTVFLAYIFVLAFLYGKFSLSIMKYGILC